MYVFGLDMPLPELMLVSVILNIVLIVFISLQMKTVNVLTIQIMGIIKKLDNLGDKEIEVLRKINKNNGFKGKVKKLNLVERKHKVIKKDRQKNKGKSSKISFV